MSRYALTLLLALVGTFSVVTPSQSKPHGQNTLMNQLELEQLDVEQLAGVIQATQPEREKVKVDTSFGNDSLALAGRVKKRGDRAAKAWLRSALLAAALGLLLAAL